MENNAGFDCERPQNLTSNMIVQSLRAVNFRNFKELSADFTQGVNIIRGRNAQGKTNLLECILLALSAKSHRENNYRNFIGPSSGSALIELSAVDTEGLEARVEFLLGEEKKLSVNGEAVRKRSELNRLFSFIFFGPDDLSVIKGGPAARRAFLDEAVSKLCFGYGALLSSYEKTLRQRNALLKEHGAYSSAELLDVYDASLADYAGAILDNRIGFLRKFSPYLKDSYAKISDGGEALTLNYFTDVGVFGETYREKYLEALRRNRKEDMLFKTTKYGIHHDDFFVFLDGRDARRFASQGQQRSVAVCLKLTMIQLIKSVRGCSSVVLLDDIMSELDESRQKSLLRLIDGMQTFITCVDDGFAVRISNKNVYTIDNGNIIRA